jgi:hypothetical protein
MRRRWDDQFLITRIANILFHAGLVPRKKAPSPDYWLFRHVISASMRADFGMISYESASHSRDYEHTPAL